MLENLSTKNKTFLFIFIILSLLLSSILFFIYTQEQSRIHDIKILNINKIQSSYDKNIVTHLEDFYIQKGELLLSPKVIDAVYKKDRLALEQLIENNYNDLKLEDIYLQQVHFHLSDGTSLYRAHNPQNFGDNIAKLRSMVTIVHQEQKIVSGFDAGKAGLTFRVFLPIFKEKVYIGALEIGVSAEKLLDVVSYFNNIDALIYMEKSKLQKDSKEIVYTNVKNKEILKRLPKDFDIEDELTIDIDGKYIFAYSIDMKDFNNDTIGKFIFFEDLTKEYTYFYNTIKQISFIFIVISVSLFIIINYTFSKLIGTLDKTKLFTDSILDNSAHAIIATDTKGIITLFNKKAQTMLGFSEEELVGKLTPIIFHKQEEMEEKLKKYNKEFGVNLTLSFELFTLKTKLGLINHEDWIYVAKDGVEHPVSIYITPLYDINRNITGYLGIAEDIGAIRQTDKLLQEYVKLIDKNIITSTTDLKGNITYVSEAFCEISGYKKEELIGENHRIIKHKDMNEEVYKNLWNTINIDKIWNGELKNLKKDGGYYWVDATISPIYNNQKQKIGYTAIRQNITDKKYIEHISITDALTNIYNRRHFNEIFPKVISTSKRKNELVCFLIMDVDHFKQYNDTYGHQKGDDVLKAIGKTLKESLKRANDYCFRLGGEEFGVVFVVEDKEKALIYGNILKDNIEKLKIIHKNNSASPYVTVSMGLVCKNANEIQNEDAVYKEADELLYQAKESGRNKVCING